MMAQERMEYIIKKFYPYFWLKFKFPVEDDTGSECIELVKNLREAVWAHRIVTFWHWYPFLEKNLIPMIFSPEAYTSYIYFMVSTTIQSLHNKHESFMTTCSLVTAVAAYVYDKGYLEYLDYSPTILMALFENFHVEKSGTFRIWDHLQQYLTCNNYSEAYDIVEDRTKGNPFADVIYYVDFVREIQFKVNSRIPVSKHAEVYCLTQEVMRRFPSQTFSDVISANAPSHTEKSSNQTMKRFPSRAFLDGISTNNQTEQSMSQAMTHFPNKAFLEVISTNASQTQQLSSQAMKRFPDQTSLEVISTNASAETEQSSSQAMTRIPNQPSLEVILTNASSETEQSSSQAMKRFPNQSLLEVISTNMLAEMEQSISQAMTRIPNQPSLEVISTNVSAETEQSISRKDLNEQSISAECVNYINLKHFSLFRPEKQTFRERNKSEIIDNEDCVSAGNKIRVHITQRNPLLEMEEPFQEYMEKSSLLENQDSIFEKSIDDIILNHILFIRPENQSLQGLDEQEIPDSKDCDSETKNIEVIVSNRSVPLEMEQLQEDVKRRVSESLESNFVEDLETTDLIISSPHPKKLPFLDKEKQVVSGIEEDKMDISEREQTDSINETTSFSPGSLRQLEQVLGRFEVTIIPEIDNKISGAENKVLRTSQSTENSLQITEQSCALENVQQIYVKNVESKVISCPENRLSQGVEEHKNSERDENAPVDSNLVSSQLEQTLEDSKISRMHGNERRTSAEDNEVINLTILSPSKEQLTPERLGNPVISESRQRVIQHIEDISLKQISLLQSEKTLPDDIKRFRISDSKQSTPLKSNSSNIPSVEDSTHQFETENEMDKSRSDSIQDQMNQSNQKSASKSKRKKKKAKKTGNEAKMYVPSNKEVIYAMCYVLQKLSKSTEALYELLDVPRVS